MKETEIKDWKRTEKDWEKDRERNETPKGFEGLKKRLSVWQIDWKNRSREKDWKEEMWKEWNFVI